MNIIQNSKTILIQEKEQNYIKGMINKTPRIKFIMHVRSFNASNVFESITGMIVMKLSTGTLAPISMSFDKHCILIKRFYIYKQRQIDRSN